MLKTLLVVAILTLLMSPAFVISLAPVNEPLKPKKKHYKYYIICKKAPSLEFHLLHQVVYDSVHFFIFIVRNVIARRCLGLDCIKHAGEREPLK